jgi:hypothetical protein
MPPDQLVEGFAAALGGSLHEPAVIHCAVILSAPARPVDGWTGSSADLFPERQRPGTGIFRWTSKSKTSQEN